MTSKGEKQEQQIENFNFSDVEDDVEESVVNVVKKRHNKIQKPKRKNDVDFNTELEKEENKREKYPEEEDCDDCDEFDPAEIVGCVEMNDKWFYSFVKIAMASEVQRLEKYHGSDWKDLELYNEIKNGVLKQLKDFKIPANAQNTEDERLPNPKNQRLHIQKKHLEKLLKQYQLELVAWEDSMEKIQESIQKDTVNPLDENVDETIPGDKADDSDELHEAIVEKLQGNVKKAIVNLELLKAKFQSIQGSVVRGDEISSQVTKLYENKVFKGYDHIKKPQNLIRGLCEDNIIASS